MRIARAPSGGNESTNRCQTASRMVRVRPTRRLPAGSTPMHSTSSVSMLSMSSGGVRTINGNVRGPHSLPMSWHSSVFPVAGIPVTTMSGWPLRRSSATRARIAASEPVRSRRAHRLDNVRFTGSPFNTGAPGRVKRRTAFFVKNRRYYADGGGMNRSIALGALLTVGTLSIALTAQQAAPRVIEVEKLKDNLYVLKGGGGNSAVFIMSNGVVVVDAKNPGWGQPILDKIKTLTDKPVTTLINTHTHGDHVSGNVEFPA